MRTSEDETLVGSRGGAATTERGGGAIAIDSGGGAIAIDLWGGETSIDSGERATVVDLEGVAVVWVFRRKAARLWLLGATDAGWDCAALALAMVGTTDVASCNISRVKMHFHL